MSVQRAQLEISSTEFLDWIIYLNEEINSFHREDFYLAQIAAEIRRSWINNPKEVKLNSFLMKFGKSKPKKLSIEEKTRRSKRFWSNLVGMNK